MKMKMEILPQEITDKYNLCDTENNGWVCIRINTGCMDYQIRAS